MENAGKKSTAAILRQKAEDWLKENPLKSGLPLSEADTLKLIHELQVHQIELELQNEELLIANSAARDAAEKYTELYDFAPSGYFTISQKDEILELNICGSQMLGKERARLKNSRLGLFISHDTRPIYQLFIQKVFTSNAKESCEVTLSVADNPPLYVHLTGIVTDKAETCLITMVDITARKQFEEALCESERHYRALVEGTPGIVYSFSSKRGGMFYSSQVTHILGYSPEQLYAQPMLWNNSIHPDDLPHVNQIIREVATFKPFCIEYRIQDAQGNWRWFEDRSTGYSNDGADVIMEGFALDITERKQAAAENAELEAQNRQLQKAESLGRMAGAIAHHFNNRLYVVMGNLEMAMDDLPLGNSNENLVSAMQAARKAAEVSKLMLTYLGQTPGKHAPIDLSELCRNNLILLRAATPKGMIVNADIPSSGPVIRADANQMHQIITNLVTNAWESVSDNLGTIGLSVKTVSHADIPTLKRFPIDWRPQSIDYACLEVSDTCSGIADQSIEKIFDPFFTTKFTGRGLGLSVVMGIVKAHGGGITVESEPGRGSVFRIFLPVSTEELPCRPDVPTLPGAPQTERPEKLSEIAEGGTVLLIEDEEPVRNMARIMLNRLGYTVLEAEDGVKALEIFQQHQDDIQCVLSDLTMPRMDGWYTLTALRKLSPDIPVILSSGYDEAQVMAGEHTVRPNAFLGKPYKTTDLRVAVQKVIEGTTRT